MKVWTLVELLLILIIISFAASKPVDEARRLGKKNLARQAEGSVAAVAVEPAAPAVAVAPAPAAGAGDDDEDFDIFDFFDDDEEEGDDDESAEDDDDESAEDPADDDDDDDESAESEEEAGDDEPDAIDIFSDLLDDEDDATPKPKPQSTVAPAAAAAVESTPEFTAAPLKDQPPKASAPEISVQVVQDDSLEPEEESEELELVRKPTPKPAKANKPIDSNQLLPLLTIQNTPALLELQAQLIGNTKNKAVDTKPKKKKKVKGSVKKQAAILSNEIGDGDMEKTIAMTESPMYEVKIKKTENKPEVIVEGPIMEKVKLVSKPVKKVGKPVKQEHRVEYEENFDEDEDMADDEESTTLSS